MPHNVDDSRVKPDGKRLEFVEGPLVRLIVFPRRRQNRQLSQLTSHRSGPPKVGARPVKSQGCRARQETGRALNSNRRIVSRSPLNIEFRPFDRWKATSRIRVDVFGQLAGVNDLESRQNGPSPRKYDRRLYASPHPASLCAEGCYCTLFYVGLRGNREGTVQLWQKAGRFISVALRS